MPWDARSRRVFLEIPDKSWCCYLAFDSFPCMEAKSSWFFLCSALAQPVLGEGLTPRHLYNRKSQLELCSPCPGPGQPPLCAHGLPSWTLGCSRCCWDTEGAAGLVGTGAPRKRVQELAGSSGLGSPTAQPPHPSCREAPARPPHPSMDSSQASCTYLHHRSAQPWLWAAQGSIIMPTL